MQMHHFKALTFITGFLVVLSSCMKDKPGSLPGELQWNPELAFPLGEESFGLNAASGFDTTRFNLDTVTGLPIWVGDLKVVMEGRIPLDLTSLSENIDDLNRVLFRVNIWNGFPHEALTQAYFLDIDQNLIDSMFSGGAIPVPPGKLIGNGETIDPSLVRKDAVFDRDQIARLQYATEIMLRATFLNPDVDSALYDYYRSYHIVVDIGIMADLTFNF
ncbi:MAG: hypothetical protein V2B15_14795 [Bacteroidota bacterium]